MKGFFETLRCGDSRPRGLRGPRAKGASQRQVRLMTGSHQLCRRGRMSGRFQMFGGPCPLALGNRPYGRTTTEMHRRGRQVRASARTMSKPVHAGSDAGASAGDDAEGYAIRTDIGRQAPPRMPRADVVAHTPVRVGSAAMPAPFALSICPQRFAWQCAGPGCSGEVISAARPV